MGAAAVAVNIHEVLQEAAIAEANRLRLEKVTFRVNPVKKELAETICEKNGTTLSLFLRGCVEALLRDYCGDAAVGRLNGTGSGD